LLAGWEFGQKWRNYTIGYHFISDISRIGLKLRNRIVWHFGHGLLASKKFSGSNEAILWFTKNDDYIFKLNAVRIPQKYPYKKHFNGPKRECDRVIH